MTESQPTTESDGNACSPAKRELPVDNDDCPIDMDETPPPPTLLPPTQSESQSGGDAPCTTVALPTSPFRWPDDDAKTTTTNAVSTTSSSSIVFKLKWVDSAGGGGGKNSVPIAMQNENGPCPLLAIFNCLSLRGDISMLASTTCLSSFRIVEFVRAAVEAAAQTEFDPSACGYVYATSAHYQSAVGAALDALPTLEKGMMINPSFLRPDDVEVSFPRLLNLT